MKKNNQPVQKTSPTTYIRTKVRSLPVEFFVSPNWRQQAVLITIIVVRKMPSDKYCVATYLIDNGCLGLKNTLYKFAITHSELLEFSETVFSRYGQEPMILNAHTAHNLIYGAIDYAEELGFKPNKDWAITEYFLDPDMITDDIDNIEFGKNGHPCYITGPYDDVEYIINTLNRTVGEGNYKIMSGQFM